MSKYLISSIIAFLSFIGGCSNSYNEYYQIFENEIQDYKYSNQKYYIEERDEIIVDYYFGIFPKNILIFRDYSLLDSNKNTILNLRLWREGALKENHGDVLTLTKYEYSIMDSLIVKKTIRQSPIAGWGPYLETTFLETKNKNNNIIQRIIIREDLKDTIYCYYNNNNNDFSNFIIKNLLFGEIITIAYEGKVIVEQKNDSRNIHIFESMDSDKLSEFITSWTTIYYYDSNFRLIEVIYIEIGKTKRNEYYHYSTLSEVEIIKVFNKENKLTRKIKINIKAL